MGLFIVKLSTWAEGNSGQIQIVIAVVALFFAFLGYKKVLEQIEISNKQDREAEEKRFFELKRLCCTNLSLKAYSTI